MPLKLRGRSDDKAEALMLPHADNSANTYKGIRSSFSVESTVDGLFCGTLLSFRLWPVA